MRRVNVVDIETVRNDRAAELFKPFEYRVKAAKTDMLGTVGKISKIVNDKAALSPVIGQLVCVGVMELLVPEDAEIGQSQAQGHEIEGWKPRGDGWWGRWKMLYGNEKDMLIGLQHYFNDLGRQDRIVTYNGRNFDMKFLNFRAVMNQVQLNVPVGSPYNGRDQHIDLAVYLDDIANLAGLDSYSFQNYPAKLKAWIEYFGIPIHKKSIADGEINLLELATRGDDAAMKEMEDYVKGDVEATAQMLKLCWASMGPLL